MENYEKTVKVWQDWQIDSVAKLEQHLENFRILFAYNSGKIENAEITYHDTREIFENGRLAGFSGSPRTVFELQNQKTCYDFLKTMIIAKDKLSVPLVLSVHRVLTEGTYDERRYLINGERPGEFKKHDYVTGINEVGAYPEDAANEVTELIDELNSEGTASPLKAGAYFHARFENIHPFADGNGRVGRTLLNYWLMINNYPPMIIYDEDKADYYRALQLYDENEELDNLIAFMKGQTVKTWARSMHIPFNNISGTDD